MYAINEMSTDKKIEFVLKDKVNGVEVTPSTIGLNRFNEFNLQVAEFIAGTERLKLDDVHVVIEPGSYKLVAMVPVMIMSSLEPDLKLLAREDSLGEIDSKRADVIRTWQAQSKKSPDTIYAIRSDNVDITPIELNAKTDFHMGDVIPWVRVEKYLFGTVTDMGGAQKANVHLRLDDSGQIVRIGTNQGYLKEQQQNRLYHKMLVRVEAEQHIKTGDLRNVRLLSFEDYEPLFDEAALDRFAEAGKKAWSDVPDAAAWVRKLRGGD